MVVYLEISINQIGLPLVENKMPTKLDERLNSKIGVHCRCIEINFAMSQPCTKLIILFSAWKFHQTNLILLNLDNKNSTNFSSYKIYCNSISWRYQISQDRRNWLYANILQPLMRTKMAEFVNKCDIGGNTYISISTIAWAIKGKEKIEEERN